MLRIAVDCRALVGDWTGIGVYTYGLLEALVRQTDWEFLCMAHRPVANKGELAAHPRVLWNESRAPLGILWQHLTLPALIEESGASLFWGPLSTLPPRLSIPSVVSAHDLTAWMFPELHPLKNKLSFNMLIPGSLRRTQRIAAVSEHTRGDFERHFPEIRGKVEVVYPGVDRFFAPAASAEEKERENAETRNRISGGRPFLLYLGTLEPRKNLPRLIEAYSRYFAQSGGSGAGDFPDLVLAGGRGWGATEVDTWRRRSRACQRIRLTGYVGLEEKRRLYRAALAFIYPSLYEGFGLPPLEAMACGAPTLVAAAASLPEVVGAGAAVFPAENTEALVRGLAWMVENPERRANLARAGLERSRAFTWEHAADGMARLFAEELAVPPAAKDARQ